LYRELEKLKLDAPRYALGANAVNTKISYSPHAHRFQPVTGSKWCEHFERCNRIGGTRVDWRRYPDEGLCSLIGMSSRKDVPREEERMSNLASMLAARLIILLTLRPGVAQRVSKPTPLSLIKRPTRPCPAPSTAAMSIAVALACLMVLLIASCTMPSNCREVL
jgi:hypothetical protein